MGKELRPVVIGDSCLDVFIYCRTRRLAPDKPVPVVEPVNRVETPGMAANTHRNLLALGLESELITNENWESNSKERIVDEGTNHMFLRVDRLQPSNPFDPDKWALEGRTVVISDYDKGFLSPESIEEITRRAGLVFLDSKKPLDDWAKGVDFIKINNIEYRKSVKYVEQNLLDKTIWTRGSQGAMFNGVEYSIDPLEVIDVSGAGDSFMAGFVAGYLETRDVPSAIHFANRVAREVVLHRGVTVPGSN